MKDSHHPRATTGWSRPRSDGRGAIVLALALLAPLPAGAQDRRAQGVFLPTEGDYEILWERIERSEKEGDWDAVVEGLARFAELAKDKHANAVVPSGGGLALGVRRIFARIVAALPPEPQRRYRERLDALLDGAWQESIERGDAEEHRLLRHRVLRDYRESRISLLALEEEIDEAFEEGRWLDARGACEDLLALARAGGGPGGVSHEMAVRARMYLAQIAAVAGDREAARRAVEDLGKSRDAEHAQGLPDDLRSAIDDFLQSQPRAGSASGKAAGGAPRESFPGKLAPLESPLQPLVLPLTRAEPSGDDAFVLGSVIWQQRAEGSRLRPFLAERSRSAPQSQAPLPYHAVARDGLVVFQHSDRVTAYDARRNREAWSLPLDPDSEDLGEMRAPLIGSSACYYVDSRSIHAVRLSDGSPLWTRSIHYDRTAKALRLSAGPPPAGPVPGGAKPESPEGEGAPDAGADQDPGKAAPEAGKKAKGARSRPFQPSAISYALSPPTFHRRWIVLAVKVRIDQESLVYLTALDGGGKEAWTTYLGSAQGGNYLGLGGAAAVPLSHAGAVYHLTNMGFLAAVDGEDGSLLWIGEYPRLDARGRREAIRTGNRWQPNPILPVLQEIVIAPQDCSYLLGVDRSTGDLAWRASREHGSTLIGADGRACFVAGSGVIAIAHSGEERGRIVWRAETGTNGDLASSQPLGRALLTRDAILLPTRGGLLRVSPADGRILSRTLWDFAGGGGNLLLTSSLLAVTNPEGILVYGDRERERAWLASLPPDRTETLLQSARSHFKNGEIQEGLEAARAWAESAPPSPAPNSPLDHIQLDLAHMLHELSRAPEAAPFVKDLLRYRVKLETAPQRKVEAAIDLAGHCERTGDPVETLAALHHALAFDTPPTEYSPDGSLRVASAAFLRDRIAALRRALPDGGAFQRLDAEAREALRDARKRATPTSYLEVIRLYPYTPAAAEAYLDLSVSFRDRQSYDQAIKALEEYLRDYPEGREVARAKLQLASLLHVSGRRREAKERYEEILKEHPQARLEGVLGPHREETIAEYVEPILREPAFAEISAAEPPDLRFPVRMSWRSPADLQGLGRSFLTPEGAPPEEVQDCFITQSMEVIECRRVEDGLPVWRVDLELIPGIEMGDPAFGGGPRLSRSGRRSLVGRYVIPNDSAPGIPNDSARDSHNSAPGIPNDSARDSHGPARDSHDSAPGIPNDSARDPNDSAPGIPNDSARDSHGPARDSHDPAPLLIVHDDMNILAIDLRKGGVRWHVPIGAERDAAQGQDILRQLRERLRGVAITESGVFATTSRKRAFHINLDGETTWNVDLQYDPAYHKPAVAGEELFIHSLRPPGIGIHERSTGRETGRLEEKDGLSGRLVLAPVEVPGSQVLLALDGKLSLLDLREKRIIWSIAPPRSTIEDITWFAESPGEVIVVISRVNQWPAVMAISLRDGGEIWRYEKFPARRAAFSVFRKQNRIYVVHGDDSWQLLALEVRRRSEDEKPIVDAIWPKEIDLGTFYSSGQRRLQAGADSIFVADPNNSISIYDKVTGGNRNAAGSDITSFLSDEKGAFAFAIIGGKLVILTDGGDCAFESMGHTDESFDAPADMELVREYQSKPGAVESTARLALSYFRRGDLDAAITLLNRSLLTEDVLSRGGPENRSLLSFLLDGIKEENMKESTPSMVARKFRVPPAIDGELNDAWDLATRVRLNAPRHVGVVPGPGNLRDWTGEEDLSADMYLGWDDQYLYFCLDVSDDVLHPYDKDAETWKGDCLLIGLDPTNDGGYRQRGNDQLMTLALTVPKRNKLDKKKDAEEGEEGEEEEDEEEGRRPDGLFSVKKKEDDTGAIYEVALPWSTFTQGVDGSAPPERGFTYGLSLLLTDDDTGQGATKTLSLNPCHLLPKSQKSAWVWRFIIPAFFPKVTLE